MSTRYFTADFHLGLSSILKYENRPFKDIDQMGIHFLKECLNTAKVYYETINRKYIAVDKDIIIHVGDLASFNADNDSEGLGFNPQQFVANIPATFINIRGNHDLSNKVKSLAVSMRTTLGKKYKSVSISHYPSWHSKAIGTFLPGDIHLCGHVHSAWKHCLDKKNKVMNINVGVDVWNYKLVSEHDLIMYIDKLLKTDLAKLNIR